MTGCSLGAASGWLVGRPWQRDSEWFLRNGRESSQCLGLSGRALGSAQVWRRVLPWIPRVCLTLDLAQSCYCSRLPKKSGGPSRAVSAELAEAELGFDQGCSEELEFGQGCSEKSAFVWWD